MGGCVIASGPADKRPGIYDNPVTNRGKHPTNFLTLSNVLQNELLHIHPLTSCRLRHSQSNDFPPSFRRPHLGTWQRTSTTRIHRSRPTALGTKQENGAVYGNGNGELYSQDRFSGGCWCVKGSPSFFSRVLCHF